MRKFNKIQPVQSSGTRALTLSQINELRVDLPCIIDAETRDYTLEVLARLRLMAVSWADIGKITGKSPSTLAEYTTKYPDEWSGCIKRLSINILNDYYIDSLHTLSNLLADESSNVRFKAARALIDLYSHVLGDGADLTIEHTHRHAAIVSLIEDKARRNRILDILDVKGSEQPIDQGGLDGADTPEEGPDDEE